MKVTANHDRPDLDTLAAVLAIGLSLGACAHNTTEDLSGAAYGAAGPGSLQEFANSVGDRVFHQKFGYGIIRVVEDNKLEINFEHAGDKKVMDAFVERA